MKLRIFYMIIAIVFMFSPPLIGKRWKPKKCILGKYYVESKFFGGRLGNQLFQIATALSLAIDHDAEAVFPDYLKMNVDGISTNLKYVFPKINTQKPAQTPFFIFKENKNFYFRKIPFSPNMAIQGFFQSEKYFVHNASQILPYFEPSEEILDHLHHHYKDLLSHPKTVAVHARAYCIENSIYKNMFNILDINYYKKAAEHFGKDALFVIFSDDIKWAKQLFLDFNYPHVFIEGQKYYEDFYLISLMKHQIISNSSFAWWAAYLNKNPLKAVIAPYPWFHPNHPLSSEHIIPDSWRVIETMCD